MFMENQEYDQNKYQHVEDHVDASVAPMMVTCPRDGGDDHEEESESFETHESDEGYLRWRMMKGMLMPVMQVVKSFVRCLIYKTLLTCLQPRQNTLH